MPPSVGPWPPLTDEVIMSTSGRLRGFLALGTGGRVSTLRESVRSTALVTHGFFAALGRDSNEGGLPFVRSMEVSTVGESEMMMRAWLFRSAAPTVPPVFLALGLWHDMGAGGLPAGMVDMCWL